MENRIAEDRETPGLVKVAPNSTTAGTTEKDASGDVEKNDELTAEKNSERAAKFRKYAPFALSWTVLYTFCLYDNPAGITLPVFMAGTLFLLYLVAKKENGAAENGIRRFQLSATEKWFYGGSLMLLSLSGCTTASVPLQVLDSLAAILLIFSLLIAGYAGPAAAGKDLIWHIKSLLSAALVPLTHLPEPLTDFLDFAREEKNGSGGNRAKGRRVAASVITGFAIALPLLAFVLLMLSSADLVFARFLEKAFESIRITEQIDDIVAIAAMAVFGFWCSYCLLRTFPSDHLFSERNTEKAGQDPVIGITVTGLLTLVYLVFSVIQIAYLMLHMKLPAGYTYAEYAHEGFYQLLIVCVLNLAIVSVSSRIFNKNTILNVILLIMCACTGIMIVSSGMRMLLYIRVYYLTFLRIFVLWFLVVLGIWLGAVAVRILCPEFHVYRLCVVSVTVLYILFALAHPDYWIARYNMSAAEYSAETGIVYQDPHYLTIMLSDDAVPAIARDPDLLAERRKRQRLEGNRTAYGYEQSRQSFRKFNFSTWIADRYYSRNIP